MKRQTCSRHVPETQAHWTVPIVDGHRPQMSMVIGEQKFHLLVDSRTDRTGLRKEEVAPIGS